MIIPSGVTTIGHSAFEGCKELISVEIPNGVYLLGRNVFAYCDKLKQLVLPPSISSLWGGFPLNGSNITDVYLYAESIPYSESDSSGLPSFPLGYSEMSDFMDNTKATLHVLPSVIDKYYGFVWDAEQKARIVPIILEPSGDGNLVYYFDSN